MISILNQIWNRFGLAAFLIGGGRLSYLVLFYTLARKVSLEQFGLFSVALAVSQVAWILTSFGTGPAAQKIIPEIIALKRFSHVKSFIHFTIFVTLLGAVVFALIAFLFGKLAEHSGQNESAAISFAAMMLAPVISFSALREFLARSLQLPILAFFPRDIGWCLSISLIVYVLPEVGAHLIIVSTGLLGVIEIISWLVLFKCLKKIPLQVEAEKVDRRSWLKQCSALMMANIGTLAFERIDVIAVGFFANLSVASVYSVASRIAPLLSMSQRFIVPVILPVIARGIATGQKSLVWQEVRLGVLASAPIAILGFIIIWGFTNEILWLFGARYVDGAWVLRTLSVAHLVIAVGSNFGAVVLMGRKPWFHPAAVWGALIPAVLFLSLLTPHFGSIAAAIVVTVGIIFYNVSVLVISILTPLSRTKKCELQKNEKNIF